MSERDESITPGTADDEDLQFQHAEYDEAGGADAACAVCGNRIETAYFQVNGKVTCERCREGVEQAFTGGSGFARFVRASIFGLGAALLGALLYYGIREVTGGYEFALVSIVIGLMVGAAVRAGAQHRGGWLYQSLAIFLTYSAIVSTYVPLILEELSSEATGELVAEGEPATPEPGPALEPAPTADPAPDQDPEPAVEAPMPEALSGFDEASAGFQLAAGLVAMVVLLGLAYALPAFAAFESPIMLLIIGIGLYEAWKLNKRPVLEITGPHPIAHVAAPGG